MRRAAVLFAAALLMATPLHGQEDVAGTWHGTLDVGAAQLRLVLHIKQAEDGYTATMDSPDQGAFGIEASEVAVSDDSVVVTFSRIGGRYAGTIAGEGMKLTGTWSQSGQSFPLDLERGEVEGMRRLQNPEPPFPYEVEEVTFPGGADGVELAGTLTLPPGDAAHPAAILVSGSGPQNRDEAIFGHRPFLVLADYLTRRGVVVLRYDDRGVAASTGDFASATSPDFADDAEAAVRYLRLRAEVRPGAIGVIGHSEGGAIAQLVASRLPELGYIVLLAGPGVRGDSLLALQIEALNRAAQVPEETRVARMSLQRQLLDIGMKDIDPELAREQLAAVVEAEAPDMDAARVQAEARALTSPWMRWFLHYEPHRILRELELPVLAINGSKDLQVVAGPNLAGISDALREGGNPDHEVVELEGLNHLLQTADTGLVAEYGQIEETMAPVALETIGDWIVERFGGS